MASILDRYGIKEVADVTFYKINNDGTPRAPVLFLDTLKVSTIEQTAENTSARGGKGNPELIMWDYGKEITVNLEDALFSAKSLAMMYGVDTETDDFGEVSKLLKTVPVGAVKDYNATNKTATFVINEQRCDATKVELYDAEGNKLTSAEDIAKSKYATGTIEIVGQKISISSDKFPGTYYIIGDTYARSETTGQDEFFQFIIPKAKMQSEVTLTMEAEGEPSTFSMNMKVLRPANGEMMKLVKFKIPVIIFTGQIGENIVLTLDDCGTMVAEGEGEIDWSYAGPNTVWPYPKYQASILKVKGNIIFPDWFFSGGEKFSSVDMGLSASINEHVFATCSSLKEVKMPNVTAIGYKAFAGCLGLSEITIPESVTTMSEAFNGCFNLKDIYLPYHAEGSLSGAPWGAANATVHWKEEVTE